MSNIGSYKERLKNFDWSLAESELEYMDGDVINIGWYCSDRIAKKVTEKKQLFIMRVLAVLKRNLLSMIFVWPAIL